MPISHDEVLHESVKMLKMLIFTTEIVLLIRKLAPDLWPIAFQNERLCLRIGVLARPLRRRIEMDLSTAEQLALGSGHLRSGVDIPGIRFSRLQLPYAATNSGGLLG